MTLRTDEPFASADDSSDEPVVLTDDEDPRVLELAKSYQAEWEAGGRPDRRRYLGQLPELAEVLDGYLDGIDMLHQGARALSAAPGAIQFDPGLRPGDRLGDFELIREVGRGGMGVVYEALETSLNRRVALKVLPAAFTADRTRLQRFTVEAQAAAAVAHPNIVPVYAISESRGIPYYVMQLIDGGALDRVVVRLAVEGPRADTKLNVSATHKSGLEFEAMPRSVEDQLLDLARVDRTAFHRAIICLGAQVARALDHAHQCGVVHRDVKPANLLLDRDGHVWVTDFGLAQFVEEPSMTHTGAAVGTLRYMSPEQAAGDRRRLDHRTDVYSLAATLYELHTGRPVFTAESPTALLAQIAAAEPLAPRSVDPAIPRPLETVLLKALAKDPADRYATASDFADDLDRVLEARPIVARRPGAWDHTKKWVGRHPGMLAVAVASLLLVIAATGTAMTIVAAEHQETQRAYRQTEQAYQEKDDAYETAKALAAAEKKRADEVERRFRRAKELGDLIFRISEDEIGSASAFQGPRRKLLLTALDVYGELISTGQDPKVRKELDDLMKRVQTLLKDLDLKREAEAAFLLFHGDVRTELALSSDQNKQIENMTAKPKAGGGMGGIGLPFRLPGHMGHSGGHSTGHATPAAPVGPPPSLSPDNKIKLIDGLTGAQRQRLRQIYVQFRGPAAFADLDVIEALDLKLDQRQKIKLMQSSGAEGFGFSALSYLGKLGGIPAKLPGNMDPGTKIMDRIRNEVLTEEQWKTWQTLTGPEFRSRR